MNSASQPSFREALAFWFKLGWISFGGPAGQIAILHEEVVQRRRWIAEPQFAHALNFCMLLPGPEAQQLTTYIGWLLHGMKGGLAAGVLFVLPSIAILLGLSWVYVAHGDLAWVAGLFDGLQPAVLALIAVALVRIGSRSLRTPALAALAFAGWAAFRLLEVPFPLVVLGAALIGAAGARVAPSWFAPAKLHSAADASLPERSASERSWRRALRVTLVCLVLWWTPVALAAALLGPEHVLTSQGLFFSQAAVVTFGGAYAVLPYVAEQAVSTYGWLTPAEMLDGLGLAESTPGPLIMVLQFVGYVGAWRHAGPLDPWLAAVLGALLTTWVTFVPCFLWVLVGAPFVERLRGVQVLASALGAITAAVTGLLLDLGLGLGREVLAPETSSGLRQFDLLAFAVATLAAGLLFTRRASVPAVLVGAAGLGVLRVWLGHGSGAL
jgi:chromate transporter